MNIIINSKDYTLVFNMRAVKEACNHVEFNLFSEEAYQPKNIFDTAVAVICGGLKGADKNCLVTKEQVADYVGSLSLTKATEIIQVFNQSLTTPEAVQNQADTQGGSNNVE